jgi:hypothetical protein
MFPGSFSSRECEQEFPGANRSVPGIKLVPGNATGVPESYTEVPGINLVPGNANMSSREHDPRGKFEPI